LGLEEEGPISGSSSRLSSQASLLATVPWSNGNDAWPTPKRRRFSSVRDYLRVLIVPRYANWKSDSARAPPLRGGRRVFAGSNPALGTERNTQWLGRQPDDHLGSGTARSVVAGMLWVRIPPEPLIESLCPRGAARSARHPVKVEIVGSNPIGDAGGVPCICDLLPARQRRIRTTW
jgi:hypothetical protein